MKQLFVTLIFILSSIANAQNHEIGYCDHRPVKVCTISGTPSQSQCGYLYNVLLTVYNSKGEKLSEGQVADHICQEKAWDILGSPICN
jgi:hypothetical protein